jgi:DNA-binding NarL/FixJ family response regulator
LRREKNLCWLTASTAASKSLAASDFTTYPLAPALNASRIICEELKPDVVILDIGMPFLNGLDTTRQLLQHDPQFKIIVLTINDADQVIREALDAGARGFVLKSDAARDLVSAVEALQDKRMFFTPRVNDLVLRGFLDKGHAISRNEPPERRADRGECSR